MAVRVLTITNISKQVIKILYGSIENAGATSQITASASGEIAIQANKSVNIEENRLDAGQIESLKRKNLITTSG